MSVSAFVVAASALIVPQRDHSALDAAIARRVDAEAPLFRDDADKHKTAAWLVAVAFRESSLRLDAVGDKGQSLCAFQIGRSSGGTDAMLTDADLCVGAAFAMLRTSMRLCASAPLAWYAVGGDAARACASTRGQRLSRDRLQLAARLVREASTGALPAVGASSSATFRPSDPAALRARAGEP